MRGSERAEHTAAGRPTQAGRETRTADGGRPRERQESPRRPPTHRRRERSERRRTAGRGRTSGREEREEGGGWPEPGEATRREPPSRRETDALPRDAPRLLTTPRFQAGGRGRALESGCGAAAGPPHTHAAARRNAGESGTIPEPLRAGPGDREPAGRETTHRANGLGGRDGRRPPPGREAEAEGTGRPRITTGPRACSQTRGRGGRGEERRTTTRARSSPRGTRGGTPRPTTLGRARTSGTGRVIDRSPRRRTGGKREHASGGVISPPGTQPSALAVPHARRAFPEDDDDGAGRVPRRTSAGGPAATPQTTDVR